MTTFRALIPKEIIQRVRDAILNGKPLVEPKRKPDSEPPTGQKTDSTQGKSGTKDFSVQREIDMLLIVGCRDGAALNVIKQLLKDGADINCHDHFGETPLMFAARGGYKPMVEFLLSNGADSRAVNNHGKTALDIVSDMSAIDGSIEPILGALHRCERALEKREL